MKYNQYDIVARPQLASVKLAQYPISVRPIDTIENLEARKTVEDYFRLLKPSPARRIFCFIKNYLNNMINELKQ